MRTFLVLALALPLWAQGSNPLISSHASDSLAPMTPAQKGIAVSAAGDIYVLVRRGGSIRELAIWRSTDLGATWSLAGTALGAGTVGSMVFMSDGVTLSVLYTDRAGTYNVTHFNQFDTANDLWLQATDTVVFSGSFHISSDDIERTADDKILIVAQTYQASPSQGLYYRFWDGTQWVPDPALDPDGTRIDAVYTSGIHAAILLDRSLPAATSEALIYYRSGTGSYGRIETKIHLGTFAVGPEIPLHGQGGGFVAGTSEDRTANYQSVMRLDSGDIYMACTANNVANSNPRVRMGHRDPAGTWTFYDVDSSANYQHGNANFTDVAVALVDGQVVVYYGKNTYTGSLTAQNGSGVYRKTWDPTTMTFGSEVTVPVTNQNGTFGLLGVSREPIAGLKEFFVYRDNSTDQDVYAYRDPVTLMVRAVTSPASMVSPGQLDVAVSVEVENTGPNGIGLLMGDLTFADASAADVTSEYQVDADPTNPMMVAAGTTVNLDFLVDVLAGATSGPITVDATANGVDLFTAQLVVDPDADTPHVWNVTACGFGLCGDCNGDGVLNIADALYAAQVGAALIPVPTFGSIQFNSCNPNGVAFPDMSARIDIVDALQIAQSSAGLLVLSCC